MRPEEIANILNNSLLASVVSALNAVFFVLGTAGRIDPVLAAVWLVLSLGLFFWISLRSLRARGARISRVSPRAIRRAILFAILSASPWAALPYMAGSPSDPFVLIVALMVCSGMSAGGAFMMHRMPIAAIAYFATILASVLIASVIQDFGIRWPVVLYTISYGVFLYVMTTSTWHTAREREYNLNQAATALKDLESANAKLERLRTAAEYDALHDSLTGLGNRRGLERESRRRISALPKQQGALAILHIDLDRFKDINDTLGHAAGDQVLVHVGELLRHEVRPDDYVARIGGDEFVILCNFDGDRATIAGIAKRIIERISEPTYYKGEVCSFGASIGIDIDIVSEDNPEADLETDPERLLANADIALYRAKDMGRGRFEFFREGLRDDFEKRKTLSDELLAALHRDEFMPLFQPQIDVKTGLICGVEALARWQHPERGMLLPEIFLPTAEHLHVTSVIDRAIFRKSLEAKSLWKANGINSLNVSMNVSASRLQDPTLIEDVQALTISHSEIIFEVLESIFADNVDDAMRETLEQLKQHGISLEIDDFGTGHTSLLGLLALRPQRLKLARELAAPVTTSALHRDLIRAVLKIAASLNIEVTAEGVENREQAEALTLLGCHRLQGFFFGEPMTSEALLNFLLSNEKRVSLSA